MPMTLLVLVFHNISLTEPPFGRKDTTNFQYFQRNNK